MTAVLLATAHDTLVHPLLPLARLARWLARLVERLHDHTAPDFDFILSD